MLRSCSPPTCASLRRPRSAERHRPQRAERRGAVHHRPVRVGQEHFPALHQPAGRSQRRRASGSMASWSATTCVTATTSTRSTTSCVQRRADIGMVFQSFNLFSHMTVLENLIEGRCMVLGLSRPKPRTRPMHCLNASGCRQGRRLSAPAFGRPAAARGDRPRPGDEPQGAAVRRADLGTRSRACRRSPGHARLGQSGMTMIVVTHEMALPARSATS
jgi:hypothetical protein